MRFKLGVVVLGVVLLGACAAKPPEPPQEKKPDVARLSEVSVSSPGFYLKPGDTLSWRRNVIVIEGDNLPGTVRHIEPMQLRMLIEQGFLEQGYPIAGVSGDYEVVAALVMGDSMEGKELAEVAQLYPSLGESLRQMEKGTLMLGVSRPGSEHFLWRSAIQGVLHPGVSSQQQQKRIRTIVTDVLGKIPQR